jgi:hypothetical protein
MHQPQQQQQQRLVRLAAVMPLLLLRTAAVAGSRCGDAGPQHMGMSEGLFRLRFQKLLLYRTQGSIVSVT